MRTLRFLSIPVLLLLIAFPAAAGPAQQTPPPTLPITLTIVTGADGTNDSPYITFMTIDGTPLGAEMLMQSGDLAAGATDTYSFNLTANFCDITQFTLTKPANTATDDPWQVAALTLNIDGVDVYDATINATVTADGTRGGSWQATHAYRDRCGVLAWTLVELTLVTGANGTTDNLDFEIGGSFPDAPYVQTLDIPGDLQPGQTDTYVFIVPMEFCEMTSFQLRKPATSGADDDWDIDELYLSIDGTEVFFDTEIEVFSPVTADSYPPNGNWQGVAAYQDRCTGLAAPPMIDPMFEVDPDDLLPVLTLPAPRLDLSNVRLLPTATPAANTLQVLPLQVTPQVDANIQVQPLQVTPQVDLNNVQIIPTQPAQPAADCPGVLPSRLVVGQLGRVTPGAPNNVRASASLQAQLVGQIPGEGVFTVISGPQCADNMAWWEVDYNGLRGWTVEGQGQSYWTEPLGAPLG